MINTLSTFGIEALKLIAIVAGAQALLLLMAMSVPKAVDLFCWLRTKARNRKLKQLRAQSDRKRDAHLELSRSINGPVYSPGTFRQNSLK